MDSINGPATILFWFLAYYGPAGFVALFAIFALGGLFLCLGLYDWRWFKGGKKEIAETRVDLSPNRVLLGADRSCFHAIENFEEWLSPLAQAAYGRRAYNVVETFSMDDEPTPPPSNLTFDFLCTIGKKVTLRHDGTAAAVDVIALASLYSRLVAAQFVGNKVASPAFTFSLEDDGDFPTGYIAIVVPAKVDPMALRAAYQGWEVW